MVAKLHERGVAVCLVSGGFRLMIEPVADRLGISRERIWANSLEFDAARGFVRHDDREPTSRSGGKPAVVAELQRAPHAHVVMVGDGGTDLEAKPSADAFIGFGGVAERGAVRDGADWFVRDFASRSSRRTERARPSVAIFRIPKIAQRICGFLHSRQTIAYAGGAVVRPSAG